jgi:division protein CdvB (Snf7/Vps24/ESCRT-III family)
MDSLAQVELLRPLIYEIQTVEIALELAQKNVMTEILHVVMTVSLIEKLIWAGLEQ